MKCSPLVCPRCAEPMTIIAFVTEAVSIQRILAYIGEPTTPPSIAPARGPPHGDDDLDQTPVYDITLAQPALDYEFDQTISW
jgi:hypothetical protein